MGTLSRDYIYMGSQLTARVIIGIISFCVAMTGVFLGNMFIVMMIGEINRKREDANQVSYFGFTLPKMLRIFAEYRNSYPNGDDSSNLSGVRAMPQVRAYAMIGMLALLGVLSACTSKRNAQLKPETFVGEYVFQMGDSGAPHHDPDRLTLRADGEYTLVHMPGGHPGSTEEGTWQLLSNYEPRVVFGNRTYPVEIRGKHIRLMVDDDLGYWYEKTGDSG